MEYIKIYTLSHPETHEVRYVGMTSKSLKQRLNCHWGHITQKNHRTNWIKSLKKINKKPLIDILDEVPFSEWQFWEQYWISQFKTWGFMLVNSTLGGEGVFGYKNPNPFWRGKKRSENQRKLSSLIVKELFSKGILVNPNPKGNKRKQETIEKSALLHQKPITQFTKDGIKIRDWDSCIQASLNLNLLKTSICNNLNNRSKSSGGYVFKYKN